MYSSLLISPFLPLVGLKSLGNKKGFQGETHEALSLLARPARFELATYGFVVRHSIQLSYGRINFKRY
jgi:hypothetical protein